MDKHEKRIHVARSVLLTEARAIMATYHRLALVAGLCTAADLILTHGKVVTTGLGKSGLVAQKLAATLRSTGVLAAYLHPVEALHGDLGMARVDDTLLMVSRSGATPELLQLLGAWRRLPLDSYTPLIVITGAPTSPLALAANVVLDASFEREADPLNLVPTASTTVAMAVGDALACVLMHARGFTAEHYAKLHPAGSGAGRPL